MRPTKSKVELRHEMLLFLSQGAVVSGFIFPSMYGTYRAWLFFTGSKPDAAISIPTALLFGLTILVAIIVSGSLAGVVWAFAMRRSLSRAEMSVWLNGGLHAAPIRKLNDRLIEILYKPADQTGERRNTEQG